MSHRILIVEADRETRRAFSRWLGARGMRCAEHETAEQALTALRAESFDAILAGALPGMDPAEMCHRMTWAYPDIPIVVVAREASLDAALATLRAGAQDYLPEPVGEGEVAHALERAVERHDLESEVRRLQEDHHLSNDQGGLLGQSGAMAAVRDLLRRAAASDATVLFTGESGTGKELAARELHRLSARSEGPFVAINCAALPAPLLESELFGHRKGAFTDASSDHRGLLEEAGRGTVLLDEVADLPAPLQPKLLRVLQERLFRPVGGTREIPLRARVVAATNCDLDAAVESGRFRRDLYYRVQVLGIELPPLRARGHDVLLLAQRFIEEQATRLAKPVRGMSAEVAARLLEYSFPGNVRELRNCIESAVVITRHDHLALADLPARISDHDGADARAGDGDGDGASGSGRLPTLAEVEGRHIRHVLRAVGGNKAAAARVLGLDRKTLYRRLSRLDLRP